MCVDTEHEIATAGEFLGKAGERCTRHAETGRKHNRGQRVPRSRRVDIGVRILLSESGAKPAEPSYARMSADSSGVA